MGLLVKRSVVDFRKHSGIFCNKFPDFWEGYQILLCVIQDLSKQMSGNSLAKEKLGGCESNQWPNIAVFWRQTQRKKASSNNPVARTTRLSYLHDLLLPDDIIKLNGFQNAKKSKNSLVKRRFIRCIYFANQKFKSNFEFSLKICRNINFILDSTFSIFRIISFDLLALKGAFWNSTQINLEWRGLSLAKLPIE